MTKSVHCKAGTFGDRGASMRLDTKIPPFHTTFEMKSLARLLRTLYGAEGEKDANHRKCRPL